MASPRNNSTNNKLSQPSDNSSHIFIPAVKFGQPQPPTPYPSPSHNANIFLGLNIQTMGNIDVDVTMTNAQGQKFAVHVTPHTESPKTQTDFSIVTIEDANDNSNEQFAANLAAALKQGFDSTNSTPTSEPPSPNATENGFLNPKELTEHLAALGPQESRFHRLVVQPFISGAAHFKAHPGWDTLAVITALPGGINAFCMITGLDPKNLLLGVARMSSADLFLSAFNAFCYISINSPMHAWFYTGLANDFKASKEVFNSGLLGKLIVFTALLVGAATACAAGSIGYSAALWLPYGEYVAFIPGFLNAFSTFASRFNGFIRIIKRIQEALTHYFNQDRQLEKNIAEKLKYVSEGFQEIFNRFLKGKSLDSETVKALFDEAEKIEHACNLQQVIDKEIGKSEFDETDIKTIEELAKKHQINLKLFLGNEKLTINNLEKLLDEINRLAINSAERPIFQPKPTCDAQSAKSWAWFTLKAMLASFAGYYVFPTFDQKGYDGINTLVDNVEKLIHTGASLHDLENSIKKLIGGLPGIASLLFYWIHLYDLPDVAKNAYAHLKDHPEDIPHALAIMVGAVFSGSSMQNVANNVANKSDNLFGDKMLEPATQVKIWTVGASAAAVNGKVIANKIYPAKDPVLPTDSPTVPEVRTYVETQHLSHNALEGFRQNSFFNMFQPKDPEKQFQLSNGYVPFV